MFVQKSDLDAMHLDELWSLHEEISAVLFERMQDQMRQLEKRLSLLNPGPPSFKPLNGLHPDDNRPVRRKYPKVWARYRNPETSETWSGRGRQPKWVIAAREDGRGLDDFRIKQVG
jgi:DNA-binding protein H-NS